jgi:hypothetical protein
MKIIPLTQGKVTQVSDQDYEYFNQWKWHTLKIRNTFYAVRNDGSYPSQRKILLHREIINAPDRTQVDHINGDGLFNIRENLRTCTNTENQRNRGKHKNNVSGFKGVRPLRGNNDKYEAYIYHEKKQIYLGKFISIDDAANAYDEAAKKYHGKFARLNFG